MLDVILLIFQLLGDLVVGALSRLFPKKDISEKTGVKIVIVLSTTAVIAPTRMFYAGFSTTYYVCIRTIIMKSGIPSILG